MHSSIHDQPLNELACYRPQRSCGQGNIFTPVCHSVHRGGSASVHAGIPPGTRQTPPGPGSQPPGTRQTPPWDQADPPPGPGRPPPGPGRHPPGTRQTPPPREADTSLRSTSGRYASYWNAFLCDTLLLKFI